MKYLSILIIGLLMAFSATMNAQNGYSIADAITVDMSTSPVVITGASSTLSTSGIATGMLGSDCGDINNPVIVYKVVTPSEGVLYAEFTNYVSLKGTLMAYTANKPNPTDWSDLTWVEGNPEIGNLCRNRDTMMIGKGYNFWGNPNPYWRSSASPYYTVMPPDAYYILFFNSYIGSPVTSDITFTFISSCGATEPDIAVTGNGINIPDNDITPSSTDDTDLGILVLGSGAISKTFTISNPSAYSLDISNYNITGINPSNFVVTSAPASTVAAGGSTTITVQFTPNTIGNNHITLTILNSACTKAKFNFEIKALVLGTTLSDKRGNMLTFDGSNDYVNIDAVAAKMDGLDDFTFEAWVYFDAGQSGKGRIMAINDGDNGSGVGNFIFFIENGVLNAHDGNSTKTYGSASTLDTWHHVAISHDNTNFNVYLDGVLQDTKTASLSTLSNTQRWSLGQEWDTNTPGDFFNGKMDEVRIWKDVRTQAEIQSYKNLTFTIDQIKTFSNLVAYYQFDNDAATGTVDGVKDILGNHGTAINGGVYNASEVAVGNGIVERQAINAAGTADFSTLGVELEFITSGGESVPNGDVVITKITTETPNTAAIGKLTNEPTAYWVINNYGTNTNLNCNVKFKFDDGEISDAVIANHKIHKRGSNDFIAGAWVDLTPTSVSATAGDNHIKVNVNSFSQFSASSSTSNFVAVLPVELTYFKGRLTTERTTELIWQTATEDNNQGFEIQRSADGKAWESIGYKSGNGTSIQFQNYKFIDVSPFSGINYYRLKQMDFDGQYDYSNIVTIESKIENKPINIFPNPIQNELNIVNGQGAAMIYNLLGQPIKQFAVSSEQFSVDMNDLPKGQYVIRIIKNNGETITKRFMK